MAYARTDIKRVARGKGRKFRKIEDNVQRMGRPTKFTPENRARILHLIAHGVPNTTAPRVVGIDPSTVREWLAIGQDHSNSDEPSDYATFLADYNRALAECEAKLAEQVMEAALGQKQTRVKKVMRPNDRGRMVETTETEIIESRDWRAAMEMLARRFGNNFRREPETNVNVGVQIVFTDEDEARAQEITKRRLSIVDQAT